MAPFVGLYLCTVDICLTCQQWTVDFTRKTSIYDNERLVQQILHLFSLFFISNGEEIMSLIHIIVTLTISNGGICLLGDYMVKLNQQSQIRKAICDNVTHALVGLLSAWIMILKINQRLPGIERISIILLGVLVSSFIDIDHFLVAKSMKLSVILN